MRLGRSQATMGGGGGNGGGGGAEDELLGAEKPTKQSFDLLTVKTDKTSPAWLFSDHASTSSWSLGEIQPGRMFGQYCSTTRNSFNILVFTGKT